MRHTPGSVIDEHHDGVLSFERGHGVHPYSGVTNDGMDFQLNGVRCIMAAGSSWYLRLSDPHSPRQPGRTVGIW
jgi:hypothetical protein